MKIEYLTWESYLKLIEIVCSKLTDKNDYAGIIGISRGGLIPATILSHRLRLPLSVLSAKSYSQFEQTNLVIGDLSFTKPLTGKYLLVDEIIDSGLTIVTIKNKLEKDHNIDLEIASILWRNSSQIKPDYYAQELVDERWINFPYEVD